MLKYCGKQTYKGYDMNFWNFVQDQIKVLVPSELDKAVAIIFDLIQILVLYS